jgi:hypothetical protein
MTLCNICGRPGCRCGELHPERLCPTHHVAMMYEAIPVYTTKGGVDVKGWVYALRCPVRGCGHARSLKRPDGPRSKNRKTTRKNK